jgi:hypothetical protein
MYSNFRRVDAVGESDKLEPRRRPPAPRCHKVSPGWLKVRQLSVELRTRVAYWRTDGPGASGIETLENTVVDRYVMGTA